MTYIVQRTCREISEHDFRVNPENSSKLVEQWKDKEAYVLLGPPGSGKTTVFEQEAESQGGLRVTTRDFLTFDKPEWKDTTLFIDGLDETRAGKADGRTPLDSIRARLDRMGHPRFRLSCREVDWFGANDRDNIKKVTRDGEVTVLRLEPLSDQDVHQILNANFGIDDPEKFISLAQDRGLQGLLTNPQCLKMLAVAVGSNGGWPDSRMQAFDMACRSILLAEHNDDHLEAQVDRASVSDLMHTCGRLCAIQLLTGTAGFTRSGKDSDLNFLRLNQIPGQDRAILRNCLQSKLFESPTQHRSVPVHRQVAEFLAARYLAVLVDNGLPVGRILALITGNDGMMVSELRGLAAWLAAHSKTSRKEVITRDPLGTVLYGDASDFSPSEKCSILDGLQRESNANPRFVFTLQLDSRLGDLVSIEMEKHYRELLIAPSREESWQSFIVILIEALRYGERVPGLADPLMALLRDDSWWPRIRFRAIELFLWHRGNNADAFDELKALTGDIYAGKVPDPDDSLLGCLLSTLYPEVIPETEIMQYLRLSRRTDQFLDYEFFWIERLPKQSTRDQLVVLLDNLVECYEPLLSEERARGLYNFFLRWLPSKLLVRILRLSGGEVDLTRLFRWLGLAAHASDWTSDRDLGGETSQDIRHWLANHPDAWKTLLAMGLNQCIGSSECDQFHEFFNCMHKEVHGRLLDSERPLDFGLWCLDQTISADDANAVKWLLGEVAECLHYGRLIQGLSRKVVSSRLAAYPDLRDAFDKIMNEFEEDTSDVSVSERHRHTQFNTEQPNWHDHVKPHEAALRENKARPALLYELAKVYFGGYSNVRGKSPTERLSALLAGDVNLVEAVLCGFRKTVERNDLPTDRQIIRLGISNRTHHLSLPFMAGLEEIAKNAPLGESGIDERRLRLALAVHYTVPMWPSARLPAGRPPEWFSYLLSNRPEVVADVLARSILSKLRNGAQSPAGIHELAHSPDHAAVARTVTLHLLKRFPVRCTSDQLSSLSNLLVAARRHCDIEPLLELINKKHVHRSMNVAQRVHWLVAGLCTAPENYVKQLDSYTTGRERRIRFLADAVTRKIDFFPDSQCQQNVPALRLLIRLIGSSYRPYSDSTDSDSGEMVPLEMDAAVRVETFIKQLATILTEDASHALEALSSEDTLRPWHSLLMDATYRQNALRREAEFAYGDVAQVLMTLDNRAPANAADLTALTLEHLRQIARDIRDGNTSDWRQYWNVDQYNRPLEPRPEAVCRDALLSDLRSRLLQLGVDVQPEPRYADDKRADFRVSYGNYNVPVEVKKSCHRSLWSSIQSQLKTRYIRDPGTGGHGIYIVFWFGDTEGCRPTPPMTGLLPVNSRELEHRLTSTLLADEQRKIRICVIDVAVPYTKVKAATGTI